MPEIDISGISFEIEGNTANAASALDLLQASLTKLKTSVSGDMSGLSRLSSSMKKLSNAIGRISDTGKLGSLASGLKSLSGLSNISIPSNIASQINRLNASIKEIQWTDEEKLTSLAQGLAPFSQLSNSNLNTYINQLSKLPDVANKLSAMDIGTFTSQMRQLSDALAPLASNMNTISASFNALPTRIQNIISGADKLNNAVNRNTRDTGKYSTSIDKLYHSMGLVTRLAAFYYTIKKIGTYFGSWVTESNDYQENLNLFTSSMGEYAESAMEYANTVSNAMGIDVSSWIEAEGEMMTLAKGFGNTSEEAALMSKNLTQLAYDISSYKNISVEDAELKVKSGYSGEIEPMRNIGYDLSVAKLQELANDPTNYTEYNRLIAEGTAEATAKAKEFADNLNVQVSNLTQATKSQLRYIAMMKEVTWVQGDMARTLETPSNQLRILNAQITMLERSLGNIFIPLINKVLPYVLAFVECLRELADYIADLAGFELTQVDYSGITDLSASADDATDSIDDTSDSVKKLKDYLLGIDELNVINPNDSTSSASGISSGLTDLGLELPEYDFLGDAISDNVSKIKAKMEPFFSWVENHIGTIAGLVAGITGAILAIKVTKGILDVVNSLGSIGSFLGGGGAALGGGSILAGLRKIGALAAAAYGAYLVITNFEDVIVDQSAADADSLIKFQGGLLLVGGGISLLTGNPIPLLVSGLAMLTTGVVELGQACEEASPYLSDDIKQLFGGTDENGYTAKDEENAKKLQAWTDKYGSPTINYETIRTTDGSTKKVPEYSAEASDYYRAMGVEQTPIDAKTQELYDIFGIKTDSSTSKALSSNLINSSEALRNSSSKLLDITSNMGTGIDLSLPSTSLEHDSVTVDSFSSLSNPFSNIDVDTVGVATSVDDLTSQLDKNNNLTESQNYKTDSLDIDLSELSGKSQSIIDKTDSYVSGLGDSMSSMSAWSEQAYAELYENGITTENVAKYVDNFSKVANTNQRDITSNISSLQKSMEKMASDGGNNTIVNLLQIISGKLSDNKDAKFEITLDGNDVASGVSRAMMRNGRVLVN